MIGGGIVVVGVGCGNRHVRSEMLVFAVWGVGL